MLELAQKVIEPTNPKSQLVYLLLLPDDPRQRKSHIILAGLVLDGWVPKVDLNAGLLHTIKYFSKQVNLS